ncbi:hypothetical protein TARUN_3146 [Trichoderma arundinaceum]|uniref:Uncharacterized protein n=1 Tax=Trichoderma arundinaceum TaxID=490622 RepID=A0A395NSM1_TRIAR|nr:hypothetical protein TARUN_3146 [Trichoderma arundinaceum]
MPYVGDDVHRATKRKWDHDGNEALRFSHPASGAAVFHVLNQQAAPESADSISARKTLPPTKRFRTIHDDNDVHAHGHGDIHSSHRRGASRELTNTAGGSKVPVKINGTVLMPCHVCHRRPTKKSDLDSFARCQSCQEQTCFVCIRECQGRNSNTTAPFLSEDEEVLSRSFHMDDADECTTPPTPNINTQYPNNDTNEREGMASRRAADSSIHHTMICSRCCVEKGAEGEVVCLGCLSDMDTA